MNGTAIKENFFTLSTAIGITTNAVIPQFNRSGCNYALPALAELEPSDEMKNDRHSVIWFFSPLYTGAELFLQKKNAAGEYEDVDAMNNDDYGTFSEFGFFVNKFSESAIGYQIEWTYVLQAHGQGVYRVKMVSTRPTGSDPDQYSFEFNLETYTDDRADGTVRVEWNRYGSLGDRNNDEKVMDFGTLDWYNQLRIPDSMFGLPTSEIIRTSTRYQTGRKVWLSDQQVEVLTWNIVGLPGFLHDFLRVDMFMSGVITFTDYNSLSPVPTKNRQVITSSNYEPDWVVGVDLGRANVTLKFNPHFENLTHKRG